jgi:hypothetical protein
MPALAYEAALDARRVFAAAAEYCVHRELLTSFRAS